jgi:hypothetical protein
MTASKKVRHVVQIHIPFSLPLSLSCYRDRERGYSKKDPSPRRKRAPSAPTDQRFEGWPLRRVRQSPQSTQAPSPPTDQRFEGWPLGRVRQPPQSTRAPRPPLVRGSKASPRMGSTAASGHSGSAPTTDQGFVGWPSKGSTAASEHTERGMTLGTSDTWPRLGLRSRGTLGHFRDQQERFYNGIPSEGGIKPSDPIKQDRVRQITCKYFWNAPLGH